MIRDIKTFFEPEEGYHKPIKMLNFWKNNYNEYESSGDKNNNLSVKKYLSQIKVYLKDITTGFQKSVAWKYQLTITLNLISSR